MRLSLGFSLFATSLVLGLSQSSYAINANPTPIQDKQPNGHLVELHLKGDEYFHWQEDAYGYTVVKHQGWYKYATVDQQGQLQPSEFVLGTVDPQQLKLSPGLLPAKSSQQPLANASGGFRDSGKKSDKKVVGQLPHLVVLVRFADHKHKDLPSPKQINVLFNQRGGDKKLAPTGSVKDLFLQNSYGQLELISKVHGWIDLPYTQAYYASRDKEQGSQRGNQSDRLKEAVVEALSQLDTTVDLRHFDSNKDGHIDALTLLHSGFGAEWGGTDGDNAFYRDRIWSHQRKFSGAPWYSEENIEVDEYAMAPAIWGNKGAEIARVGVLAHEIGHQLGLPDLYGSIAEPQSVAYDFMANPWDLQASQYCPPQLSLWSKIQLGWHKPTAMAGDGQYQLRSSNRYPESYRVNGQNSSHYWLIENRQIDGFDCAMNQGGLIVWQIDSIKEYTDARGLVRQQNVRMLSGIADKVYSGLDEFNKQEVVIDDHIAMNNITKTDDLISFCINQCMSAPTDLKVSVKRMLRQGFNIELTWVDNADDETQIIIERCRVETKNNKKRCQFKPHANVAANVTIYRDNVSFGQYLYRVKAVNANSSSSYSKPAST